MFAQPPTTLNSLNRNNPSSSSSSSTTSFSACSSLSSSRSSLSLIDFDSAPATEKFGFPNKDIVGGFNDPAISRNHNNQPSRPPPPSSIDSHLFYLKTTSIAQAFHYWDAGEKEEPDAVPVDSSLRSALQVMASYNTLVVRLSTPTTQYDPDTDCLHYDEEFAGLISVFDIMAHVITSSQTSDAMIRSALEEPILKLLHRKESQLCGGVNGNGASHSQTAPLKLSLSCAPFPPPGLSSSSSSQPATHQPAVAHATLNADSTLMEAIQVFQSGVHWVLVPNQSHFFQPPQQTQAVAKNASSLSETVLKERSLLKLSEPFHRSAVNLPGMMLNTHSTKQAIPQLLTFNSPPHHSPKLGNMAKPMVANMSTLSASPASYVPPLLANVASTTTTSTSTSNTRRQRRRSSCSFSEAWLVSGGGGNSKVSSSRLWSFPFATRCGAAANAGSVLGSRSVPCAMLDPLKLLGCLLKKPPLPHLSDVLDVPLKEFLRNTQQRKVSLTGSGGGIAGGMAGVEEPWANIARWRGAPTSSSTNSGGSRSPRSKGGLLQEQHHNNDASSSWPRMSSLISVVPGTPAVEALHKMLESRRMAIGVTDPATGELLGQVTARDFINAFVMPTGRSSFANASMSSSSLSLNDPAIPTVGLMDTAPTFMLQQEDDPLSPNFIPFGGLDGLTARDCMSEPPCLLHPVINKRSNDDPFSWPFDSHHHLHQNHCNTMAMSPISPTTPSSTVTSMMTQPSSSYNYFTGPMTPLPPRASSSSSSSFRQHLITSQEMAFSPCSVTFADLPLQPHELLESEQHHLQQQEHNRGVEGTEVTLGHALERMRACQQPVAWVVDEGTGKPLACLSVCDAVRGLVMV